MMNNMKLVVYVNEDFEDQRALFDLERKKTLLVGDFYHDKIDEKIDGYLQALKDFEIYKEEVEYIWINPEHEHFEKVGLYN
jgi:hypothetical protein